MRVELGGQHTLSQIGEVVGRSRSRIIKWMRVVSEEGLDSLLSKHPGREPNPKVQSNAIQDLRKGLRRGRWKRAKDEGHLLAERNGLHLSLEGGALLVKKSGVALKRLRLPHTRKDAEQSEVFKTQLARRLLDLGIPGGQDLVD